MIEIAQYEILPGYGQTSLRLPAGSKLVGCTVLKSVLDMVDSDSIFLLVQQPSSGFNDFVIVDVMLANSYTKVDGTYIDTVLHEDKVWHLFEVRRSE